MKTGKIASKTAGKQVATQCPCGKGLYADCCAPLHNGAAATSAEALMRSRYSAYVLKLSRYLLDTWHRDTRPTAIDLAEDTTQWLRLEIRRHEAADDAATVEFVARYKLNGRACRLHEISRFACQDARWYYLDGELFDQGTDPLKSHSVSSRTEQRNHGLHGITRHPGSQGLSCLPCSLRDP